MTRVKKNKRKTNPFWEAVAYFSLAGCILGQIVVGYAYLFAQCVYLVCNLAATIRSFAIRQNPADKVKNCVFTAITLGLIIIWVIRGGVQYGNQSAGY